MPDMTQAGTLEVKGTIRVLKLNRETLRELGGGLTQEQGKRPTSFCNTERRCSKQC